MPSLLGFGSGFGWAQGRPFPYAQERAVAQRNALAHRRKASEPASPEVVSVVETVNEPAGGALGVALAACDKGAASSEVFVLPGPKGELKLDHCYRGRDHLVCSFNALSTEARSLIEGYGKIVEAHYPDVSNVDGVCSIKPDNLANDQQSAIEFANRFKALKAEYTVRTNCTSKIAQSLKDVTLRDMAMAPEILKSMTDAMEAEVKAISVAEGQVVDLADKINASQKALTMIRMIHRAMCLKDERVVPQNKERVSQEDKDRASQ